MDYVFSNKKFESYIKVFKWELGNGPVFSPNGCQLKWSFLFPQDWIILPTIYLLKKYQLVCVVTSCPLSYKFYLEIEKNSPVEHIFYHCVSTHIQCTLHDMIYEFLQFLHVSFMYVQVDMEMDCVVWHTNTCLTTLKRDIKLSHLHFLKNYLTRLPLPPTIHIKILTSAHSHQTDGNI